MLKAQLSQARMTRSTRYWTDSLNKGKKVKKLYRKTMLRMLVMKFMKKSEESIATQLSTLLKINSQKHGTSMMSTIRLS